jgi:hypothetical protein
VGTRPPKPPKKGPNSRKHPHPLNIRSELGLDPAEETRAYTTWLVAKEKEQQLVALLGRLEDRSLELGVADVQLSLTSLEDVFLAVSKKVGGRVGVWGAVNRAFWGGGFWVG